MRPTQHHQAVTNATISSTAVVPSSTFQNISNHPFPNLVAYLRIANAPTGTTPSLTLKLQVSGDGTNWADVPSGAFAAQTAASGAGNAVRIAVQNIIDPWIRVFATVSGTSPSFSGVYVDLFFSADS